jgi:L-iditol 2-dehydrogenase
MSVPVEQNRSAVLHGARDLRIEARDVPALKPYEVLVKVASVGICGSDVHYYRHGRIGRFVINAPMTIGHELSGVVANRGSAVTRHEIGDRVCIEPGVACGRCRECRQGRYNLCPDMRFLATPPVHGACSQFAAIHEDCAVALPESVSDNAGALIEPLAVGVWACKKGGVAVGHHVLVTGAGPIGMITAQVALAAGAFVTLSDINARRLAFASRLGEASRLHALDPGDAVDQPVDVVIECSGAAAALDQGLTAVAAGGTVVVVGMGPDPVWPVSIGVVQRKEVALTGTFRYAHAFPTAIALAASGQIDLDTLVTSRFSLDETERALCSSEEDPGEVKAIVRPNGFEEPALAP